jgi:hypothetical protein
MTEKTPKPTSPSQADEALRRARQADARPLPTETRARRRAIAVRGW